MHPTLIDLGVFELPSYGVLIAIGVIAALWSLKKRADGAGMDGSRLVDFALWLVIWALLGAKILLVMVELPRYLSNPASLLGVLRAGGVFLGGFIAAVIAAIVLLKRYSLPALETFDVVVPSLALGQAIGRLGCLAAGCCWGATCDLPWAVTYTSEVAAQRLGTPLHQPLHPFPAYAAIFNVALYLGLAWFFSRRPPSGQVFASYLVVYGIGRFFLELTRGDAHRGFVFDGLLSTSQLISALLVALGIGLWIWAGRGRAT